MHDSSQYTFFHEGFESPSEVKSEISELRSGKSFLVTSTVEKCLRVYFGECKAKLISSLL